MIALAPAALGGVDYPRQEASFTLTEDRPGRATGERFSFDYVNPDDPAAKPPAVARVRTVLPRGGSYDPAVPESCEASDLELMASGPDACPPGSAVGEGVVTVDTGIPGPARIVTADVRFFNNATDPGGEFIYVNTVRGTPLRTVIRADVTERETITTAPFLPGTLPDGGAIDTVEFELLAISRVIDGERRHYIATPERCPRRRHWTTRLEFSYPDGESQPVKTRTPCRRRAGH